jgi:hypothetical protein
MKKNVVLAGLLSLFVPGLGQIYVKKHKRGAAILFAAIVIGNLNALWLTSTALSNCSKADFWNSVFPRIVHDVSAFWAVAFWVWAIVDAIILAKKGKIN